MLCLRLKPAPIIAACCLLQEVCIQRGIEAPTIMSESGRALASHHSVLVFDVLTKRVRGGGAVAGLGIAGGRSGWQGKLCAAHLVARCHIPHLSTTTHMSPACSVSQPLSRL